jgi:hypothetical protein
VGKQHVDFKPEARTRSHRQVLRPVLPRMENERAQRPRSMMHERPSIGGGGYRRQTNTVGDMRSDPEITLVRPSLD